MIFQSRHFTKVDITAFAPTSLSTFQPCREIEGRVHFRLRPHLGGALGSGIKWDTCDSAITINMNVNFVTTATFTGTLFGKAVL